VTHRGSVPGTKPDRIWTGSQASDRGHGASHGAPNMSRLHEVSRLDLGRSRSNATEPPDLHQGLGACRQRQRQPAVPRPGLGDSGHTRGPVFVKWNPLNTYLSGLKPACGLWAPRQSRAVLAMSYEQNTKPAPRLAVASRDQRLSAAFVTAHSP
jgi:hypothetical protein